MPKKTRISSKKSKFDWKKLLAIFLPVIAVIFVLYHTTSGTSVLGASTQNLFNLKKSNSASNSASNCKPMISAITLSSACDLKNGQSGFKSVSFTCKDGTTGSSTKDCLNPQQALEKAGKTCSKNSGCKPTGDKGA